MNYPSSQLDKSIAALSYPRGYAPTSPTLDSCDLKELALALQGKLTLLENLSLLNDTGKSLLSLCRQMTSTPSTPGAAPAQESSGTSTSLRSSGNADWEALWLKELQERNTRRQNLGPTNLKDMQLGTTRGFTD